MARWLPGLIDCLNRALDALCGPAATVSAHVDDELLQFIYVTPTATGISIELQLTPGVLVAPELASLINSDGDRVISGEKAAAYLEVLRSHLAVQFGETSVVVPRLLESIFPDFELLRAGGATVVAFFAADSPVRQHGEQLVKVTNTYAPMQTVVQGSVLLGDHPIDVAWIGRNEEGRTLIVQYTDKAAV